MRTTVHTVFLAALAGVAACSDSPDGRSRSRYEEPGPHPVGNARFAILSSGGDRVLTTEAWYPAAESEAAEAGAGFPIEDFVPPGPDRAAFTALLATAHDPGTRRRTQSKYDAEPTTEPGLLPVVLFSHCHECTRFSAFTVAERLASWGFVVIAPDHAGNTLFDGLAGTGADIGDPFLAIRGDDLSLVLDSSLSAMPGAFPEALRGRLDGTRVGVFGHSFGGATVGRVLQEDPRVSAGFAMGAPVESFVFPSVTLAGIDEPLGFLLLEEDDSIGPIGNDFIVQNFEAANPPVWLIEMPDAGHWSVSDLCGIVPDLGDGCIGEDGSWAPIAETRADAATWATAFFELRLNGVPDASTGLDPDVRE